MDLINRMISETPHIKMSLAPGNYPIPIPEEIKNDFAFELSVAKDGGGCYRVEAICETTGTVCISTPDGRDLSITDQKIFLPDHCRNIAAICTDKRSRLPFLFEVIKYSDGPNPSLSQLEVHN